MTQKLKSRPSHTEIETSSHIPVNPLYTPADLKGSDYESEVGYPGEYPFTRGVQATMYRGRLWTMRQYAGMGDAEESNKRYKYLLANGTTGLSVAFDLPTQIGLDSDHPLAAGEVGKVGVAIDSIEDMQRLFDGIELTKISTSMTINATASILLALYVAVARRQGGDPRKLSGTVQNDVLKEYIARGTYIYPPHQAMRVITDMFAWANENVPDWNTISISGYHMREAGSTAVQEVAFTLGNGMAYVEAAIKAGLDVDKFAPRLSFFFNAHNNFLEEVAKFRAARRMWARIMREHFKAQQPQVVDAALPHADGRINPDGSATGEQYRPHGDSGDGRRAGRHAIAPHQFLRRSIGTAHGAGGAHRFAHAAGDRLRVRGSADYRSARRIVLRGIAHQRN